MKKTIYLLIFLFNTIQANIYLYAQRWYPFTGESISPSSVLNTSSLLDAPAGKHGWLLMDGNDYNFTDGTSIKFWGVNICNMSVFPDKDLANRWSSYLARQGVNGVRFHKFTWDGTEPLPGSTVIEANLFDRLDYFHHILKEKGIYTGWSHIYGHRVRPADSTRIKAYNEIVNAGHNHLKGSTIGLVHFAPDLQQLSIELTVNMLNHHNPYTGMRYADDPALSFIELQNEDNAFFPTTIQWMEECPTYKAMICKMFSMWLKEKYGSQDALVNAWGNVFNSFKECYPNESLNNENINPMPHHWYFSNDCFDKNPQWHRRLFDSARFIYECQQSYYDKMVKAIRATGYKGVIVGSCWQAGDHIAHYYNLYSDYNVGVIDRHNYFGGSGSHTLKEEDFNNTAMISSPGSGLLGTGMQQVEGRPFVLSEWMSLIPNEWIAEASPLIALYGLGLQGWDGSFSFASNQPGVTSSLEVKGGGVYNSDSPLQIALYPALFRMLLHGDIETGKDVGVCHLHVPSFIDGKLGFRSDIKQQGDQKQFSGVIPLEAMAVGRVVNVFEDEYQETTAQNDFLNYYNKKTQEYTSTTGQFVWNVKDKGYFTMNTSCSKAVVGFNPSKSISLGNIKYKLSKQNPFAIMLLTSLEKGVSLDKTKRAFVTLLARAKNTDMSYNQTHTSLISKGKSPLLLEPVSAEIVLQRPAKVYVLDHTGIRTGKEIKPNKGNRFYLRGENETIYYEIEYIE